jgi:hypothetical protein
MSYPRTLQGLEIGQGSVLLPFRSVTDELMRLLAPVAPRAVIQPLQDQHS